MKTIHKGNPKSSHWWIGHQLTCPHCAAMTEIQFAYLSKSGTIVTSDYRMVCYNDEDRPVNAPSEEQDRYWETPTTYGEIITHAQSSELPPHA